MLKRILLTVFVLIIVAALSACKDNSQSAFWNDDFSRALDNDYNAESNPDYGRSDDDYDDDDYYSYDYDDEYLTVDSDNWEYFFQEDKDDEAVKFARRFCVLKGGSYMTTNFFEDYGYNGDMPLFLHDGDNYYIVYGKNGGVGVLREDLITGQVSTDFSWGLDDVDIETPSDYVISEVQDAVDIFCDLLPDFHGDAVTADSFKNENWLNMPVVIFDRSNYAYRDDGFSQVMYRMTGDGVTTSNYTCLCLIYEYGDLIAAMFIPGNVVTQGLD